MGKYSSAEDFYFCKATERNADLGHSNYRWRNIYATNGSINTSDINLKENIIPITDRDKEKDEMSIVLYDNNFEPNEIIINDFHLTDIDKYAKKNIDSMLVKSRIRYVFNKGVDYVDDKIVSQPIVLRKDLTNIEQELLDDEKETKKGNVEQITLFDDFDD